MTEEGGIITAAEEEEEDSDDLSSLVTIVVVTSPIESNPSTELLDRCLSSIVQAWPPMKNCRMVIAADGCECTNDCKKKQQSKRKRVFGKADAATIVRYQEYLDRIEKRPWMTLDRPSPLIVTTKKDDDHDANPSSALSTRWLGFALTLQKAIETHVTTPLVFVTPHDYELLPNSPLQDIKASQLVRAILMQQSSCEKKHNNIINYVGLPNAKSLTFRQRHADAMEGLENVSIPASSSSSSSSSKRIVLEPLGLWKENPHFASVQAYREFVFGGSYHRFKRGHFIEDTLGQQMLQALKQQQQQQQDDRPQKKKDLFGSFGTYLFQSENGVPCTYHVNGLKYIDTNQRKSRGYPPAKHFEVVHANAAQAFVQQMNEQAIIHATNIANNAI